MPAVDKALSIRAARAMQFRRTHCKPKSPELHKDGTFNQEAPGTHITAEMAGACSCDGPAEGPALEGKGNTPAGPGLEGKGNTPVGPGAEEKGNTPTGPAAEGDMTE